MKRLFFKLLIIFAILTLPNFYFDPFNVFHWKNVRFTSAEVNKNFVKTKYILENPRKFNAFLFGSSRVGNYIIDYLPETSGDENLKWYNMTYSEGVPYEHLLTLKTFLKNNIDIKCVFLAFDDIGMYADYEQHNKQLMRKSYQKYEENKLKFYFDYLASAFNFQVMKEVLHYNKKINEKNTNDFYGTGAHIRLDALTPSEEINLKAFENWVGKKSSLWEFNYEIKNIPEVLQEIQQLCDKNNIKLYLVCNPINADLYKEAVEKGYLDYLLSIGKKVSFYNFSGINKFTTDKRYYFEYSHFKPCLAIECEKTMFDSVNTVYNGELFGNYITPENAETQIQALRSQLK